MSEEFDEHRASDDGMPPAPADNPASPGDAPVEVRGMRTDDNRNPTAFTVDVAVEARLVQGTDYEPGTPFANLERTARLLGDPVATTIRVIRAIGFYTAAGAQRWSYIGMPKFIWDDLTRAQKRDVIGFMYQREGGTAMRDLFPNYGTP